MTDRLGADRSIVEWHIAVAASSDRSEECHDAIEHRNLSTARREDAESNDEAAERTEYPHQDRENAGGCDSDTNKGDPRKQKEPRRHASSEIR